MNIENTQAYYKQLNPNKLCSCAYCRNYIKQVKKVYPIIAKYLQEMGIDIEKPFETMPLDITKDGFIDYIAVLYIVLGVPAGFKELTLNSVNIDISVSHPDTKINEPHFVLQLSPIRLKWSM